MMDRLNDCLPLLRRKGSRQMYLVISAVVIHTHSMWITIYERRSCLGVTGEAVSHLGLMLDQIFPLLLAGVLLRGISGRTFGELYSF